jgi:hypothetical protein
VQGTKSKQNICQFFHESRMSEIKGVEPRPNRAKLAEFYGQTNSGKISDAVEVKSEVKSTSISPLNMEADKQTSPFDINSSSFDPELYSQKLIKVYKFLPASTCSLARQSCPVVLTCSLARQLNISKLVRSDMLRLV